MVSFSGSTYGFVLLHPWFSQLQLVTSTCMERWPPGIGGEDKATQQGELVHPHEDIITDCSCDLNFF